MSRDYTYECVNVKRNHIIEQRCYTQTKDDRNVLKKIHEYWILTNPITCFLTLQVQLSKNVLAVQTLSFMPLMDHR